MRALRNCFSGPRKKDALYEFTIQTSHVLGPRIKSTCLGAFSSRLLIAQVESQGLAYFKALRPLSGPSRGVDAALAFPTVHRTSWRLRV